MAIADGMGGSVELPREPMTAADDLCDQRRWVTDRASRRAMFAAEASDSFAAAAVALAGDAEAAEAAVVTATASVRSASGAFEIADRGAVGAAPQAAVARERIAEEFDRIRAMTKVAGVTITSDSLIVTTVPLRERTVFRIRISRSVKRSFDLEYGGSNITFEQRWNGRFESYATCWGSLSGAIRRAVHDQEFDVIVQQSIALLEAAIAVGG